MVLWFDFVNAQDNLCHQCMIDGLSLPYETYIFKHFSPNQSLYIVTIVSDYTVIFWDAPVMHFKRKFLCPQRQIALTAVKIYVRDKFVMRKKISTLLKFSIIRFRISIPISWPQDFPQYPSHKKLVWTDLNP